MDTHDSGFIYDQGQPWTALKTFQCRKEGFQKVELYCIRRRYGGEGVPRMCTFTLQHITVGVGGWGGGGDCGQAWGKTGGLVVCRRSVRNPLDDCLLSFER